MRVAALAAAGALAALAGCGGGGNDGGGGTTSAAAPAAARPAVVIKTFEFTPRSLTVARGTKVTWVDDDEIDHTVTSGTRKGESDDTPDGRFDIRLADKGAKGSFTFTRPGTYTYYCTIHPGPGMTGRVVVR